MTRQFVSLFVDLTGTLVRRHRIPKPAPHDDQFYTVDDFNVGAEVTIYGRTFMLFTCDGFTKTFLTKLGVRVGEDVTPPIDSYSSTRKVSFVRSLLVRAESGWGICATLF